MRSAGLLICCLLACGDDDASQGAVIDAALPDAPIDIPVDAFACNDDGWAEPNNTIQQAFDTAVAANVTTVTLTGLAICPPGDKDTFKVEILIAQQNLEVIADYAGPGSVLEASVLNASALAITYATPVAGMPQRIRAYAPALPIGTYYASISAAPGQNNYSLTITATGP